MQKVKTIPNPQGSQDPVDVLMHETDPAVRSRAHRELGRRAAVRQDRALAAVHFQEALELDPTDEQTAEELRRVAPTPPKPGLLARFLLRGRRS